MSRLIWRHYQNSGPQKWRWQTHNRRPSLAPGWYVERVAKKAIWPGLSGARPFKRMLYLGRRRNAYLVGLELAIPRRCSTSCGASSIKPNSPESTSGESAISSHGTNAAPNIDATHSTRIRAGSCTVPKLKGERSPV